MPKMINCQFHNDDTASLALYEDGYKCFGCQRFGPLAELKGVSNEDIPKKYIENIQSRLEYIRGLPKGKFRGFDFHHNSEHFFIVWPDGDYYKARRINDSPGAPKYKCPAGHQAPLLKFIRNDGKHMFLVEGELNAMSVAKAFPSSNVASPGSAGSFGKIKIFDMEQFLSITLIMDNDGASAIGYMSFVESVSIRSTCFVPSKTISKYFMNEDANKVLLSRGEEALRDEIERNVEM